jgi:hypothetical protein
LGKPQVGLSILFYSDGGLLPVSPLECAKICTFGGERR